MIVGNVGTVVGNVGVYRIINIFINKKKFFRSSELRKNFFFFFFSLFKPPSRDLLGVGGVLTL